MFWDSPASILYKSIAGRYRPVSYPDGPIRVLYRFIKNASWVVGLINQMADKNPQTIHPAAVQTYQKVKKVLQ